ncbi:MAG: hypothetical protein P8J02_05020 [Yoonia sp.]|nr:hypothetical protein [Yoonia sp.]
MIQKALWDSAISKVRRLTDPVGKGSNKNLSLEQLVFIAERANWTDLTRAYGAMLKQVASCRKHADKYLAHLDLTHAHGSKSAFVTCKETTEAVSAIGEFVRLFHLRVGQVDYVLMPVGNAEDEKRFLMHLYLGNQKDLSNRKENLEKDKAGQPYKRSDYAWPDWVFDTPSADLFKPFDD